MSAFGSALSVFSRQCLSCVASKSLLLKNVPTLMKPAPVGIRTLPFISALHRTQPKAPPHQETVVDNSEVEKRITSEIITRVNTQIQSQSHGRLFAVVHIMGKQWKITPDDVLVVEGTWPPNVGDVIRLEKVLLVGSSDFTLVGRPLLQPDLVNIQATVIEKRLSHTKTNFKKKRRKQYMRINFFRVHQTMLRINCIDFKSLVNEKKGIEGVDGRIF